MDFPCHYYCPERVPISLSSVFHIYNQSARSATSSLPGERPIIFSLSECHGSAFLLPIPMSSHILSQELPFNNIFWHEFTSPHIILQGDNLHHIILHFENHITSFCISKITSHHFAFRKSHHIISHFENQTTSFCISKITSHHFAFRKSNHITLHFENHITSFRISKIKPHHFAFRKSLHIILHFENHITSFCISKITSRHFAFRKSHHIILHFENRDKRHCPKCAIEKD